MLFVATKASLKLPPSTKVIGFRIQFCYHAIIRLNYRKPEGSITSAQLRLLYLTVAQRCALWESRGGVASETPAGRLFRVQHVVIWDRVMSTSH